MAREMSWYHFQLATLKLQGRGAGDHTCLAQQETLVMQRRKNDECSKNTAPHPSPLTLS
jgi:hypothetical protein